MERFIDKLFLVFNDVLYESVSLETEGTLLFASEDAANCHREKLRREDPSSYWEVEEIEVADETEDKS